MQDLNLKIELWKKRLLDIGKGNGLISFKETKRSNIAILSPGLNDIFKKIVHEKKYMSFSYPTKAMSEEDEEGKRISIITGQIETNLTIIEEQRTLKAIRARAKTSIEEHGVNTLFLTFGMIKWRENSNSEAISSPVLLVPVNLKIESINAPYTLKQYGDEVILNPALSYKLENEYGITLPEFNENDDASQYLSKLSYIAADISWEIKYDVYLALLSFSKISIYKDIDINREKILVNPIIKALSGDLSNINQVPKSLNNFKHDECDILNTFQVADADSSQLDAISLSKMGISFVLQGPPGTGKSQTITNIIAEAVADGKKVLFVAEKLAALEIVKKRLDEAGLNNFCMTLHSHRANKRDILDELQSPFKCSEAKVRDELLYKLSKLEEKRSKLNKYVEELHSKCLPLNESIYEINGRLARLYNTEDVVFSIKDVENTTAEKLNKYKYLITEYVDALRVINKTGNVNPWSGTIISELTHEIRHNIEIALSKLLPKLNDFADIYGEIIGYMGADFDCSVENTKVLKELLDFFIEIPPLPIDWLKSDLDELVMLSNQFGFKCKQYFDLRSQLTKKYSLSIFDIPSDEVLAAIEAGVSKAKCFLDSAKYSSHKDIVLNSCLIANECRELKDILKECMEKGERVFNALGLKKPESINSLLVLGTTAELICKEPMATEKWFNEVQLKDTVKILRDAAAHQKELTEKSDIINKKYKKEALSSNYEKLLRDFNESYIYIIKVITDFNNTDDFSVLRGKQIESFEANQRKRLLYSKNIIERAVSAGERVTSLLNTAKAETREELINLCILSQALSMKPHVTAAYFDSKNTLLIDEIIREIKLKQLENKKLSENILGKYIADIFNIDYKGMLSRFNTEYIGILRLVNIRYKQDKRAVLSCSREVNIKLSDDEIISLLVDITTFKENEQWLSEKNLQAEELIGALYDGALTDWDIVEKNRECFKIIKDCFGVSDVPPILQRLLLERSYEAIEDELKKLNKKAIIEAIEYIDEIMKIKAERQPLIEVLTAVEEVCNSISCLNNDFSYIKSLRLSSYCDVGISEVIEDLKLIKDINICIKWFRDKSYLIGEYLGKNYNSIDTDFKAIEEAIDLVGNIKSLMNNDLSKELIAALTDSKYPKEEFADFIKSLKRLKNMKLCERLDSVLKYKNSETKKPEELKEALDTIIESSISINESYHRFTNLSKDKFQFESVMTDINSLYKIQKIEQIFKDNEKELKLKFSNYCNGIYTDWDCIVKALEYAKKLKEYFKKFSFSDKFLKAVCKDDKAKPKLMKYLDSIEGACKAVDEKFKWFSELYENPIELYSMNIYEGYKKIKHCMNFTLLEDWIDFLAIRKQCMDYDLESFIEEIEQLKVHESEILNIFLKRFYKLWMDEAMKQQPAVLNFRGRTHQSLIEDFNELDKLQLKIAALRIKEKLIERLPDINAATSSSEEMGILKRELSKQRNIMPLRRLFKEIPSLLTTLKPCLMMSPLAVSLYLQADSYSFDLVIFDEASQICTEDAIGSIIRGKQIIIAGDRYQLPPTDFFNPKNLDKAYDSGYESEGKESVIYDSILEESVNSLPERTLRWHYRSRHESLIAFSNSEIYKNELITFPSNTDNFSDRGVEYIYVQNGIYDRGARKNNINEANRVAELVFEHFNRHPNRSLGVVTFSEAQQQAIENAIRKKRLKDSSYEEFFSEERDEEFFVKNLETVQGDERDTIIFSIGYGKDSNGIMYMNFGPLSKNGGYRRLNVAITRAKYNVKLIGSIMPDDINLDKTNSDGVKLLKQYIEYAINVPWSIENFRNKQAEENKNEQYLDYNFENVICEFLTENGYSVHTKIGFSDCRIDMAVLHPNLSGTYVLGIECDGESYHRYRTARERDRLRQSVLENIGWKIYRIWSTDWIKDSVTEGQKLLEAVRKSVSDII